MILLFDKKIKSFPDCNMDKNSLFDKGRIGEMGLCVNKNKAQCVEDLSYPAARGIGLGKWMGIGWS